MQEIVGRNFNESAVHQRADVMAMKVTLRESRSNEGFVFNDPELRPFEARLREAGFYTDWKSTWGDEAWANLETAVGRSLA